MKLLPLSSNQYTAHTHTKISDEWFEICAVFKWYVIDNHEDSSRAPNYKIVRCASPKERSEGFPKYISLHRFVKGIAKKGNENKIIDHFNKDKFDNTDENLRITTPHGNARNSKQNNGLSTLWGVSSYKKMNNPKKPFVARFALNGKKQYLGYFETELEAHQASVARYKELTGQEPRISNG